MHIQFRKVNLTFQTSYFFLYNTSHCVFCDPIFLNFNHSFQKFDSMFLKYWLNFFADSIFSLTSSFVVIIFWLLSQHFYFRATLLYCWLNIFICWKKLSTFLQLLKKYFNIYRVNVRVSRWARAAARQWGPAEVRLGHVCDSELRWRWVAGARLWRRRGNTMASSTAAVRASWRRA